MVLARFLVADPPWSFNDKIQGGGRGAEKHYRCMTVNEILRMPLPPIHDQAVLFLWRVSSMVEEAYQVVRAWGFAPKSEIVWNKTDATGEKDALGMGHIVRGSHETCIVATRGKLIDTASKSERTIFRAPRTKHSEKPEEFYQIVERLYPIELWPESHVELFARRRRKGWIQFGDELPPEVPAETNPGSPKTVCVIHGETEGPCRRCSAAAIGVELRRLLACDGWNATNWRSARHLIARDEIDEAREEVGSVPPPENMSAMVAALSVRALEVPLTALAAMSVTQRDVIRAYLEQGGDPPEFLAPFVREGAHVP